MFERGRAHCRSRAALFAAPCCRSHSRDHGVSDPAADVKARPTAALTGSLTPWLPTVLVTVCEAQSSRPNSAALQSDVRASWAGEFPGKSCTALDAQSARESSLRAPVGHHVLDAGAVLGGVQGSALRFDRALARPSGLDAASAQLRNWQLRDGLYWDCRAGTGDLAE
jgi:hypothetical protein